MRRFIDERKTAIRDDEIGTKVTHAYFEIEFPLDKDSGLIIYVIPRSKNSAAVMTCWEHAFDELVSNLDEDTYETVARTWPTLAKLIHNGINDRYRDGALIRLEDFDDCEAKWFVASMVGNVSFDNPEDLFCERMQEVTNIVTAKTLQLFQELNENTPNWFEAIGKGFIKGFISGIAAFFIDPQNWEE